MPRRREIPKREILPDPKFKSEEVAKFINVLMTRGKKSVAERIMYGALDQIAKKSGKDPFEVFGAAIGNVKPTVEVEEPSGRWGQLPGSGRGEADPAYRACDALAAGGCAQARREEYGSAPGQ